MTEDKNYSLYPIIKGEHIFVKFSKGYDNILCLKISF